MKSLASIVDFLFLHAVLSFFISYILNFLLLSISESRIVIFFFRIECFIITVPSLLQVIFFALKSVLSDINIQRCFDRIVHLFLILLLLT